MVKAEFGWRIPSFPVDGSSTSKFIDQINAFIKEVEGRLDSAWISDHFHPWAKFQSVDTDVLEAWTTLSYLAGVYRKLKFGNIVLCNSYRNPALLAKMASTLQALTNGRLILGIGAGWKEDEYLAYGYEFPSAKVRIRQLEEAVQIIKKLWTEDPVNFDGAFYKVKNAYCNPKPDPIPPIMIGGGGEKLTLRVVARFADWWNLPNVTVAEYERKIRILERHCKIVGRDPKEIRKTWSGLIAIAEEEEEALKIAKESPFLSGQSLDAHLIGTPETIIERIRQYLHIGVDYFILRFLDFPEVKGLKTFCTKVLHKI
ncbi:LLM class F420-dependent oxidoreductase [Candidatus Bathyarchaeota archaeon B24-2]|nr:MAG: LLM class F420-dependent oxidoreductase [Candidatus Bathyarchaeota archaeon B24-2]